MDLATEHTEDIGYCTNELRHGDRARYLTTLLAPARARPALVVLYAFKLEVAKTHAVVSEPLLGQIRLQWWRESLDGVFAGEVRRHAVLTPLRQVVERHQLPREPFDAIIGGHERDLDPAPFADMALLEAYGAAVEGSLVTLAMAVLGDPPGDPRRTLAREAGIVLGIAGLLRRMGLSRRSGPLPITADLAVRHGLAADAIRTARPADPSLRAALADVAATARRHLGAARALRHAALGSDLPALLPVTAAAALLRRIRAAAYDVTDPRVTDPAPGESWRLLLASLLRRF